MAVNPNIKITADTSQAERAIKNLDKALEDLNASSADVAKFFGVLTAAAAGIGLAIKGTLDSAGALVDAANMLGVGADQLRLLQQSAELAGIGADQLNAGLVRLSKNIGDALIKGGDEATAAFTRLGIPLETLAGMNPADQFKAITTALLEIPDRATRSALAVELLGKQGPALLAAAENTERLNQQMKDLGLNLTKIETAGLDSAGDSLTELKQIFSNALFKAVADIAPLIVGIVEAIKDAIKEAGGFKAIWGKIKEAIHEVINFAIILGTVLVARVVVGAVAFVAQLVIARGVMGAIATIMARTPIGLLAAGAALLASKLGVDVVGSLGETLNLTELTARGQKIIAENAAAIAKNLDAAKTNQQKFTEEQQKALKALDDQIASQKLNVQYQKDILQYGEEEAAIIKKVSEEKEKLLKTSIDLTNEEVAAKLRSYEAELRAEDSIKRQIKLRQQQADAIISAFESGQTQLDRAIAAQEDYNDLINKGLSLETIKANKVKRFMADDEKGANNRLAAQAEILNRTNDEVNAVLAKNNAMWQVELDYSKKKRELENLQLRQQQGYLNLTIEQEKSLREALLQVEADYQTARVKAAIDNADKIYASATARIETEMFLTARLSDYKISEMDRELLYYQNQEQKKRAMIAERLAFEKKTDLERVQFGIDQGQVMFAALGKENKKAFEASKALAIASALINTYQGATKALATYPWPFGLIAAAAAVAAGYAQINAIKSQQYSGKMVGGAVAGAGSYIVGEKGPELFTPGVTGNITPNHQMGGNTNINFTIVANDTAGFDELLTSRRGMIQQIVSDAMLERGQRM